MAALFDLLLVIDCMMSTLCHVSTLKMIQTSNHSHTFIFNFHLVLCEEEVIVRINQCMTGQQEQMQGVTMSENLMLPFTLYKILENVRSKDVPLGTACGVL